MTLSCGARQEPWLLLAGCFLLLLGLACPWRWDSGRDYRESCLLPSLKGPCKALIRRWYHDTQTKTCKEFDWGGCEGNDNNFKSKEDCERNCRMIKKKKESCLLPRDVGFCKALIPRWYYDRYTKTCTEFNWGGCGGNDNNFLSQQECEETCYIIKRIPDECRLEPNRGRCRGSFERYFFNINTMKCEKFIYGGCGGNENRFFTTFSCMNYCLPAEREEKNEKPTAYSHWMPY